MRKVQRAVRKFCSLTTYSQLNISKCGLVAPSMYMVLGSIPALWERNPETKKLQIIADSVRNTWGYGKHCEGSEWDS